MSLRPLHDRVLVRRVEEETTSPGGILIPDNAKEKPSQGEVLAVGAGKKDSEGKPISLDVKVGDTVYFGQYAGTTIKIDNEELLVMREDDIVAVVE